jgi:hypothetical protein
MCDQLFFEKLHEALVTDVLSSMSDDFIKELRYFAKCMEPWLKTAMESYPAKLLEKKLQRVRSFAHTLRRYTSLNHLAKAGRAVLEDRGAETPLRRSATETMLDDLSHLDFGAINAQAQFVCKCPQQHIDSLVRDFRLALREQFSLLQWVSANVLGTPGTSAAVVKPELILCVTWIVSWRGCGWPNGTLFIANTQKCDQTTDADLYRLVWVWVCACAHFHCSRAA